jgi:hypothetical protein
MIFVEDFMGPLPLYASVCVQGLTAWRRQSLLSQQEVLVCIGNHEKCQLLDTILGLSNRTPTPIFL